MGPAPWRCRRIYWTVGSVEGLGPGHEDLRITVSTLFVRGRDRECEVTQVAGALADIKLVVGIRGITACDAVILEVEIADRAPDGPRRCDFEAGAHVVVDITVDEGLVAGRGVIDLRIDDVVHATGNRPEREASLDLEEVDVVTTRIAVVDETDVVADAT